MSALAAAVVIVIVLLARTPVHIVDIGAAHVADGSPPPPKDKRSPPAKEKRPPNPPRDNTPNRWRRGAGYDKAAPIAIPDDVAGWRDCRDIDALHPFTRNCPPPTGAPDEDFDEWRRRYQ